MNESDGSTRCEEKIIRSNEQHGMLPVPVGTTQAKPVVPGRNLARGSYFLR